MTLFDAFRYDGKRALVVGGPTGMGAAAAELTAVRGRRGGGDGLRRRSPYRGPRAIHVNLAERDSIDAAVDQCGGRWTPCSRAPVWPTAPRVSRRSTSSDTGT